MEKSGHCAITLTYCVISDSLPLSIGNYNNFYNFVYLND